jgi:hypothetical protein
VHRRRLVAVGSVRHVRFAICALVNPSATSSTTRRPFRQAGRAHPLPERTSPAPVSIGHHGNTHTIRHISGGWTALPVGDLAGLRPGWRQPAVPTPVPQVIRSITRSGRDWIRHWATAQTTVHHFLPDPFRPSSGFRFSTQPSHDLHLFSIHGGLSSPWPVLGRLMVP